MNRPPTQMMVMGHPLVATPMTLVAGVTLLAGFHAGNVLVVLIAIAIVGAIRTASDQARAYRQWKAEWDGMAGQVTARTGKPVWGRIAVLALGLALFALMLIGGASTSDAAICIGLLAGGICMIAVMLRLAIRCLKGRRPIRATKAEPVKVVAKTILPVPTLDAAYAALPEYCRQILGR